MADFHASKSKKLIADGQCSLDHFTNAFSEEQYDNFKTCRKSCQDAESQESSNHSGPSLLLTMVPLPASTGICVFPDPGS